MKRIFIILSTVMCIGLLSLISVTSEGDTIVELTSESSKLSDGKTYQLENDVNLIAKITVAAGRTNTIALNSKTLTGANGTGYVVAVEGGATLTIIGDGSIYCGDTNGIAVKSAGDLTINGGEYSADQYSLNVTGGSCVIQAGTFNAPIQVSGGSLLVKSGKYKLADDKVEAFKAYLDTGLTLEKQGDYYVVKSMSSPKTNKEESHNESTYCEVGDLNCDGYISCEEENGSPMWYWDESKQACMLYEIVNTGTK